MLIPSFRREDGHDKADEAHDGGDCAKAKPLQILFPVEKISIFRGGDARIESGILIHAPDNDELRGVDGTGNRFVCRIQDGLAVQTWRRGEVLVEKRAKGAAEPDGDEEEKCKENATFRTPGGA